MYPRQSPATHTEQLGDEVAVYDRARAEVHSLNPTAACVWRRCDGLTSPDAIAAAVSRELGISEADAVVDLTLRQLARAHLLEQPIESRGDRPATTRRWLLGRGLTAAMLPAVYSIVAPSPAEAQSVPPSAAPTLTTLSPNQGTAGTTVPVTLTGTNFVTGATTVTVGGGGVTVMAATAVVRIANITVSSPTSLTANFVIDPAAAAGPRAVTVTTAGGTSGAQTFMVTPPPGSQTFSYPGSPVTFTVPAGVVALTVVAAGAKGSTAEGGGLIGGVGGLGGRITATVSVTPGASLIVTVGGAASGVVGGFNGGGGSTGFGGGGGGASSVLDGATPLVIAGGGGGGGSDSGGRRNPEGGAGGAGGNATAAPGETVVSGGGGGGGGTQLAGGAGGIRGNTFSGTDGTDGTAGQGGIGGYHQPAIIGGGGGGGGYFGGGGGGGGSADDGAGGGGGGSSFAAPIATGVTHDPGFNSGDGSVTISW